MTAPLTRDDIRFRQRLLKSGGQYIGEIDGLWGPKTDAAERLAERRYFDIRAETGAADPRSEAVLASLQVPAQRPMRLLLAALSGHGWTVRAISGTRSYPEQDRLFAQGRTAPGPIVTNAPAGHSNHNWGTAIDIGVFDDAGRYLKGTSKAERKIYRDLGAIGREVAGISWGGDFSSIEDNPHYELRTGLTIKEARRRFEAGLPLVG